jgi:hypothetical protein
VKLVMTLIVRDEADVVDAQLAFHLNTGVDLVLAIDHRSQDGTTEILQTYERGGYLRLLREEGEQTHQAEWMTRLARLAAVEHGADWVFCSDGDEFWSSPYGGLKELLEPVPRRYGVIRGAWRHFVARPDDGSFFAERMVVRTVPSDLPASAFHYQVKVMHRAHPQVSVLGGNHDAVVPGLAPLRGWYPIEVLHFPIRSRQQFARKYRYWRQATELDPMAHPLRPIAADAVAAPDAAYESRVVDGDALDRGLADGTLALDTRVRDALRLWRQEGRPGFVVDARPPDLRLQGPDEEAAFVREVAALAERDASEKLAGQVERLEQRLAVLERSPEARVRARLEGPSL